MSFSRWARHTPALLLVALGLSAASAAWAHHSFAMYDNEHQVKLKGKVTDFQWTNPHVYIELDLTEPVKGAKHWSIELGSPSILQRGGWKFNMLRQAESTGAARSWSSRKSAWQWCC